MIIVVACCGVAAFGAELGWVCQQLSACMRCSKSSHLKTLGNCEVVGQLHLMLLHCCAC